MGLNSERSLWHFVQFLAFHESFGLKSLYKKNQEKDVSAKTAHKNDRPEPGTLKESNLTSKSVAPSLQSKEKTYSILFYEFQRKYVHYAFKRIKKFVATMQCFRR